MKHLYEESLGRIRIHFATHRPNYVTWTAYNGERCIEQALSLSLCWILEDMDNQIFQRLRNGQGEIIL
jgi:hypothetical protein